VTGLATALAFACGLIAGLPQIARMIRGRSSSSQSAIGWTIGAKGAAATAYVGVAEGAAPVVYGPSIAAAVVATAGLGVTLYYADGSWWRRRADGQDASCGVANAPSISSTR
jgi:hypothetical protein